MLNPPNYLLYEAYDGKDRVILTAPSYEEIIEQIELHKVGLKNKIGGFSIPLNLNRLSLKMIVDLPIPNKRY